MGKPHADAGSVPLSLVVDDLKMAFRSHGIDSPDLSARLLVEHASGCTHGEFIANPHKTVPSDIVKSIQKLKERRLNGEPVYRIIGAREFYGLPFELGPAILEPRPDTETLVDTVLPIVEEVVKRKGGCAVLDLGTGSGAIGVSIAANAPAAIVTATDVSPQAVEIANLNALKNGVADRYRAIVSDWYENVRGNHDVIVSNPPYIATADIAALDIEVRDHDPLVALDGGCNGLQAYSAIAAGAGAHLIKGGVVAVEIGAGQRADVVECFLRCGFSLVSVARDLGGIERVLVLRQ